MPPTVIPFMVQRARVLPLVFFLIQKIPTNYVAGSREQAAEPTHGAWASPLMQQRKLARR